MPGESGVTVVTMLVCFFISHTRLRAQRAPGIPCPLSLGRGRIMHSSGVQAPRECEGVTAVSLVAILRDAAKSPLLRMRFRQAEHIEPHGEEALAPSRTMRPGRWLFDT